MTYRTGDYVFPTDLPRRFLCRVEKAETFSVGDERSQILRLTPLEGPWPSGTALIRLDPSVMPAGPRDLWSEREAQGASDARPARRAVAA